MITVCSLQAERLKMSKPIYQLNCKSSFIFFWGGAIGEVFKNSLMLSGMVFSEVLLLKAYLSKQSVLRFTCSIN